MPVLARRECDEDLIQDLVQRGLHLVRVFRNAWGALIYDVVKDPEVKLSDLADLSRLSEILGFEVRDRLLIELEDDDSLTLIEVGLKYGLSVLYFTARGLRKCNFTVEKRS